MLMRPRTRWLTLIVVSTVAMGCAVGSQEHHAPRIDRTVLARDQMVKARYVNVYDAVLALRPQGLRPRGPESFLLPLVVWVYVDNVRLGDVETLRTIQPSLVTSVRFYDGPSATGRWGVGHGAGVIHVSTWSTGALGFPGTVVVPDSSVPHDSTARDSTARRGPGTPHDSANRPGRPKPHEATPGVH
jgi:hypothetical protein